MADQHLLKVVARRRHFTRIRKTVAGAAIALFIALFSTIYVQMAAGHDPAPGTKSAQAAVVSSAAADNGAATTTPDPAPVTTRQS